MATTHKEEPFVRKTWDMKSATLQDNRIRGAAAVMGNLDRGGDVIFPGAFKKALSGHLKTGFVPDCHNWYEYAKLVAMPISAKEQGSELVCEAEFHTTQYAQDIRTLCMERLDKGLYVGLSIGFMIDYADPDGRMWFENGKAMIKYIEDEGIDSSGFDLSSIRKCDSSCRAIRKVAELPEWSFVPIGMNPKAQASEVKTFSSGGYLRDRSEPVIEAVKGLNAHISGYVEMRAKGDRQVPADMRDDWVEVRSSLAAAVDELDALLKSSEPSPDVLAEVLKLRAQSLVLDTALIGL